MGNCGCSRNNLETNQAENPSQIKLSDFTKLYKIGKGCCSKIWKVKLNREYNELILNDKLLKNKSRIFAMKVCSKAKIYLKKMIQSRINYRKFLETTDYNLLIKMYYAFQDKENLYIILNYLSGGDLRYHICRKDFFTEQEIKFVSSCIILNLNYLYEKNIVCRDLKPENLIFDSNGYLYLSSLNIAMECKKGETITSLTGTPGYMAPETIINRPHDFCADYFAFGVILYELTFNERPYNGNNRKEITDQMFTKEEINLNNDDLPEDFEDYNIIDLINGLLKRKKGKRLGSKGISEIKNHPYFKNIPWEEIENMKFKSPFIINNEDNFDKSYVEEEDSDSIYEGKKENYINEINESLVFNNFYFNIEDKLIKEKEKQKND